MRRSSHLRDAGYWHLPVLWVTACVGLAEVVFTVGSVSLFRILQGAHELSFSQLMALGGVLGGIPTTVTLWVIHVLYDLRAKVAKLEGVPARLESLDKRMDDLERPTIKEEA